MSLRIALLTVSFLLVSACKKDAPTKAAGPPPPTPVSVGTASVAQIPVEVTAIGTAEASSVVQVKSQIGGELLRVLFTEGGTVNKGDLLFEIDSRPIRESIRQVEAAIQRDTALLSQAEATLARDTAQSKSIEADASRYDDLFKQGVGARQQRDQTQAAAEAIRASMRADQASIESARASLENDRALLARNRIDLDYTQIHAPITGRVGNLLVHPGNIVAASSTTLVVINQVEPIWVSFAVPEEYLSQIRKNNTAKTLAVEAVPNDSPDEKITGALTVIDNTVDTTTGSIRLKATFANDKRTLWPGQYANVTLRLDTIRNAVVVPSEAVQAGQNGQIVFVVKENNTVDARPVKLGPVHGDKTVIEKGVENGETVVVDGQMRLAPNARIQAVPASGVDSKRFQ